MRLTLGLTLAAVSLLHPDAAMADGQSTNPELPPREPGELLAPPRRRSEGRMVAGIVLTSFGALSVAGGIATVAVGTTTDACKWGGNPDCNSSNDVGLILIGALIVFGGGGLGLGLGIPLWVSGAKRERPDGEEEARIVVGPGSLGVRGAF